MTERNHRFAVAVVSALACGVWGFAVAYTVAAYALNKWRRT